MTSQKAEKANPRTTVNTRVFPVRPQPSGFSLTGSRRRAIDRPAFDDWLKPANVGAHAKLHTERQVLGPVKVLRFHRPG